MKTTFFVVHLAFFMVMMTLKLDAQQYVLIEPKNKNIIYHVGRESQAVYFIPAYHESR